MHPENMEERAVLLAEYIIETSGTVRSAAARFGISKSTVHKDLTERLKQKDRELWRRIREVLERNKAERHLRGGEATRRKYSILEQSTKKEKSKIKGKDVQRPGPSR